MDDLDSKRKNEMSNFEENQFKIDTVNRIIDSHIEDWKVGISNSVQLYKKVKDEFEHKD